MVITMVRLGVLMLSNLGYWEFFRKKCKINVYFLPAFTIAAQFMVLFAAGLLNFLAEAAFFLYFGGLFLFLAALCREKIQLFKPYLNWGYAFLAVATILAAVALRSQVFAHYDNFSHWALVVQKMLSKDRFPNFRDEVITFQSYPLGSATYIYYFCKMTYAGESMQMLAQTFMMLCMILPWFRSVKKHHAIYTVLTALMANFLFCYNTQINELLVDTLLPLAGMATVLFVENLCRENSDTNEILYAIPLLCLTVQIKNSGIFFVVLAAALILASLRKNSQNRIPKVGVCASPLVINLLWSRHCSYVFLDASTSRHAMSADNFNAVFSEKGFADIQLIVKGVAEYAVKREEIFFIIAWMIMLGVISYLVVGSISKRYITLLISGAGLYIFYMIGIVGMYVFSMPLENALILAAIDRYTRTIDIAIYYLIMVNIAPLILESGKRCVCTVINALLVVAALVVGNVHLNYSATIFQKSSTSSRMVLQNVIEEYGIPQNQSYFICIPEADYAYTYYLGFYLLDSIQIRTEVIGEESQLEAAQDYNYFISLDEGNPIIETWRKENYPDQENAVVIEMLQQVGT